MRLCRSVKYSNEADAFWRLESKIALFVSDVQVDSNEADAFWRLEWARMMVIVNGAMRTPMRQTPFGVWNNPNIANLPLTEQTPMRQTPFGVWNRDGDGAYVAEHMDSNEADAFWRLESATT